MTGTTVLWTAQRSVDSAAFTAMGRSLFKTYQAFATKNVRYATTGCPFSKRQRSQIAPTAEVSEEIFTNAKPYSEVPGPKPIPILGNTWRMVPVIGQYDISEFAKVTKLFLDKYGRIVRLGGLIGRPDLLFVYDADEIERMYRREGPTPFRPAMPCLVKYKSEVRKDFFGELPGVVGVHGEKWRQFRSKVQRPILQPQTVKKYVAPIETVTEDFIRYMENARDELGDLPHEFDNDIHRWSLECIGRVALDTRLGCLSSELTKESEPQRIIDAAKFALRNVAVLELKAPYWRYIPTPLWTKYVNNMNFFVELCSKYINEALERLKTKKVTSENDLSLLERVLASEGDPKIATIMALDLILVGIDTISMAVCSILYQAATRLPQQEKMAEEIARVFPDPTKPINYADLDKLHYTKAFVREVFRMYSTVIGNGRTLQEDDVICGYHIPKGVQVVFPTIVTGNMEQFVSNPLEFKPERWLEGDGRLHSFASLPYGFGARICLGRRFADLEIQVLLVKLIRRYRLEYHHEPLDYAVTFMYAPEGPLRLRMIER
ncbi:probable cytochrome P450 301a1, mitochondrial [Cydia pomonella]|uniref:probable cytochrome P450 301a1, mitochondrial n=1 Tax=Cydia pomonella TaxID=82600 RepID=UPI002ADD89FE|nr:probable cytochrome P450 301a1, mitochondrial [Cydia pomonella]